MILDRHFERIKENTLVSGICLTEDQWETVDVMWGLRKRGVVAEAAWAEQINGHIRGFTSSASSS